MPILDPFNDVRCAALQRLAQSKDYPALINEADAYWNDGSAGDCIWAMGHCLELGQATPPNTPIWKIYIDDTALFFIGSEISVRARINSI